MSVEGTVYLIHFDEPFKHARHYIGWSQRLEARLEHHRRGTGARLMAAVSAAGIPWSVVQTWPGTRTLERRLHRRKGAGRFCPTCKGERRNADDLSASRRLASSA